jgi:LPXTG-motif cell wall-anchored protein
MKGRFKLLALVAIIVMALGVTGAALAAPPATQNVCPEGDGWSNHQDPGSFGSVEGADQYCVKGGSSSSEGCTGYLEIGSFEYVSGFVGASGYCGLSHWSYQQQSTSTPEDPTATPTPEDPTATPTEGPSPTPTDTDTPGDPTSTPTPKRTPPPEEEPETGPGDMNLLPIAGFGFALLLVGAGFKLVFSRKQAL